MNEGEHVMRRVYSSVLVVLCIVLVSGVLVGCFGASEEPTTVAPETTISSSTTTDVTDSTDSTSTTEGPDLVDGLPREYVESLGQRPILVLFYVPGGVDDDNVLTSVQQLQSTFTNYTFLIYQYDTPADYGDLAAELGTQYPPETILIDRLGVTQKVWTGYVDKATLNQSLLDIGRY